MYRNGTHMKKAEENHVDDELWLDVFCWEAIVKILFLRGVSVWKIHYCQISRLVIPFVALIQKISGILFLQIDDFVSGEELVDGCAAYDAVHTKLKRMLERAGDLWVQNTAVQGFASKNKCNLVKIKEHLKEAAFCCCYRPVELSVIAKIRSKGACCRLLLRKTPFSDLLAKELMPDAVLFYPVVFSHRFPIGNRDTYLYDELISDSYFSDRFQVFYFFATRWFFLVVNTIIAFFRRGVGVKLAEYPGANIGVELLQSRVKLNEINDFFWLKDSQIDPKSVFSLERHEVDSLSENNINALGINRVALLEYPWQLFKRMRSAGKRGKIFMYITADIGYVRRTIVPLIIVFVSLVKWDETAWLRFQLARYLCRVFYWKSIYDQLNIKILSSIIDIDADKLAKAQALEMSGGFYTGSHYSNFPAIRVDNQKCYDILFTWGPHFASNILNRYPALGVFNVGYILDYYFEQHRLPARTLRAQYPGTFILSYQDNIMANDLPYSWKMQADIHTMLMKILDENDHVVLFLKPKRKAVFETVIAKVPGIEERIREGRIVAFLGETEHTKAVPAMIGMASDLVVGLGVSTAAAECQFAGTPAFHADLSGSIQNEFANKGLGRIVFRDIDSLHKAITDRICGYDTTGNEEFRKLNEGLDPFQDGQAYRRVGFVIEKVQELMDQNLPREKAVECVVGLYSRYVGSTAVATGLALERKNDRRGKESVA